MAAVELQDLVTLIRMEYAEMPDLSLNRWQAQRLWSVSADDCERALGALVRSGYLQETRERRYVRRDALSAHVGSSRGSRRSAKPDSDIFRWSLRQRGW
jgi:hypothetical protein